MAEEKRFTGTNADDAWMQLSTDITWQESANNYRAVIHAGKYDIFLETVRSPGGGEEGWGFEQTTFRSALPANSDFRFAIVPEDFLNRLGKFFGMQDVKIGYPEFDENVLVQTNDEQKLKRIFEDSSMREAFQNLSGYSFHIDKHEGGEEDHLHLVIQRAIIDPLELKKFYRVFYHVLQMLEQ